MTKYIFHEGSGTILDADDGVFIIDSDEVPFSIETEEDLIAAADEYGVQFTHSDINWNNCISYSPSASRSQASYMESGGEYEDAEMESEAISWALEEASDKQLNDLAHWIMEDDEVWGQYRMNFASGLFSFYDEVVRGA